MTIPALNYYLLPGLPVVACEYPHHSHDPSIAKAKRTVLEQLGVAHVLDLTEEGELLPWFGHGTFTPSRERFAIRDVNVPDSMTAFDETVDRVAQRVALGETIAVHCWGGVGRTGLFAAALLVRFGWSAQEALAEVNRLWRQVPKASLATHRNRTAPETPEQHAFVQEWARTHAPSRPTLRPLHGVTARQARGCLLGGALGDALGAAVEFIGLDEIRTQFGEAGVRSPAPAYGVSSPVTDDTQMTLFTAEGLLRGHMGEAYVRWLYTQEPSAVPTSHKALREPTGYLLSQQALHSRRAPGITCLSALRAYATADVPHAIAANDSKGCGTVMRVAPIGLVAASAAEAYADAKAASALTHGHRTGIIAGGAFAVIIQQLRDGASLGAAIETARGCCTDDDGHDETVRALNAAVSLAKRRASAMTPQDLYTLGEGWIAEEALAIAVACALAFPHDFVEATCLAANLVRGDSDSTASMTGQIVGLMVGPEELPSPWLDQLELRGVITQVADDLAQGTLRLLEGRYPS